MRKLWLLFVVLLVCVAVAGCGRNNARNFEKPPHWFASYKDFDQKDYYNYLQDKITALNSSDVIFYNAVSQFYKESKTPIWTANGWQEGLIDSVMDIFSKSAEQGIQPSFFSYEILSDKVQNIKSLEIKGAEALYDSLSRLELLLTHSYLTYAKSMAFGATDPVVVNGGKWLFKPDSIPDDFAIKALESCGDANAFLRELIPCDSDYVALQRELCKYLALKDTVFPTIPVIEADSGRVARNVHLIGERLRMTGELPESYVASDTLGKELMPAINLFRENHAIPRSKHLDEETIKELNRQPSYYINKLSANLERYRWRATQNKGESFIAVNTADFTLQVHHGDSIVRMRVCCGKSLPPKDTTRVRGVLQSQKTESPMLRSEINYIVLNPIWSIPASILKDEYYYKFVKSNTAVVKKEHLHIIDLRTKKEVAPESIDWKKVNRRNIPYQVFQESGKFNSLGLVKFNFPNTESVYLHDTNNKSAFKRRVRTLSHGCVRVEKPIELATQLLTINGYDTTRLEQVMITLGFEPTTEEGEEYLEKMQEKEEEYFSKLKPEDTVFYRPLRPTTLALKQKMPVYIEYYTCFLGENGHVQYRPDCYRKENNILFNVR